MSRLRPRTLKAWAWVHTWTSLVCTAFLLMLCLTGLPLIFKDEIASVGTGSAQAGSARGAPTPGLFGQISLDRALTLALDGHAGERALYLSFDEDRPVVNITTGVRLDAGRKDMRFQSVDLVSGRLVAPRGADGPVMATLLRLHVDMFAGLPGELFLGAMGVLFCLAIVSGVVLYAPFMRERPLTAVRTGRPRTLWLDLHNLLGIAVLAWTLVVGGTGVLNTLSVPLTAVWRADQLASLTAPYKGMPVSEDPVPVQQALAVALAAAPGTTPQFIAFPGVRFSSSHHYAVWLHGATPATQRLLTPALVDAATGQLTALRRMPWYMLALRLSQPLHFGDYGGLMLKVVWAALDLIAIAVLGSGLYLWLARRRKPRPAACAVNPAVAGRAA